MTITRDIILEEYRCYDCGRFWMLERGVPGECPHCASVTRTKAWEEVDRANKSATSLRGHLNRLKKQNKQ